jgi:murein L,D-transpeptidase YafK
MRPAESEAGTMPLHDMPAPDEKPRRSRGGGLRFLVLIIVLIAGAAAGFLALVPHDSRDAAFISLQRHYRVWLASIGKPMPGTPDLGRLDARLAEKGLLAGAPIFMRIFKREFELELFMLKDGRYEHFATYPICKWSGRLGPKLKTGDRQAPEGFYSVDRTALNPNSRWHRSFNLGFPNAYDRALGRTGSFLMVHGGCGSIGCYAMTNPVIDEIWLLINRALDRGQKQFQVQVFPFRMTNANLSRYADSPWHAYWTNLKTGHDLFEAERVPPVVGVCNKTYAFVSGLRARDASGSVTAQCTAGMRPADNASVAQPPPTMDGGHAP